jgi:Phosphoserine phosphatase RsbU, N-terminal domain
MTDLAALTRDYRVAFLRYLPQHEETALARAYELGRESLTTGVSLLDVLNIHHVVLTDLLNGGADEIADTVPAAGAFLTELLAPYDMVQRGLLDRG